MSATYSFACDTIPDGWVAAAESRMAAMEHLRKHATYNTGTITLAAAIYLQLLTKEFEPSVIAEIGTFIGNSTRAMLAGYPKACIYTCDKDNDCLDSVERIKCHPKMTSTEMLGQLLEAERIVNFFFFDGRIQLADLAMILRLSQPSTVYAFDDYYGKEKGVANVALLRPYLTDYTLLEPPAAVGDLKTTTTIAVLAPTWMI